MRGTWFGASGFWLLVLMCCLGSCDLVTGPISSPQSNTGFPSDSTAITESGVAAEKGIRFKFYYDFKVQGISQGARRIRVWIPAPKQNGAQKSRLVSLHSPVLSNHTFDLEHRNSYLYFESALPLDRPLHWQCTWQITRRQVVDATDEESDYANPEAYLQPNRLVPDHTKILELTGQANLSDGTDYGRARQFYDFVRGRMSYSKHASGWGRGDALWACDSRYGNCTDYHAVFIGMSRASGVPARFEMGFPLPYVGAAGGIGGYHCWASFHDGQKGWWPVDISEADKNPMLSNYFFGQLNARRVHFTTGRDLVLKPPQDGPPLNYFIYPYVEIDTQVHENVDKSFSFDSLEVLL